MCSLDILIAGKYRLGRKLGGGSFGEIFLGTNLQTGEEVGIKLVSQQRWGGVVLRTTAPVLPASWLVDTNPAVLSFPTGLL